MFMNPDHSFQNLWTRGKSENSRKCIKKKLPLWIFNYYSRSREEKTERREWFDWSSSSVMVRLILIWLMPSWIFMVDFMQNKDSGYTRDGTAFRRGRGRNCSIGMQGSKRVVFFLITTFLYTRVPRLIPGTLSEGRGCSYGALL